jgi:hypothetical protein
MTKDLTTLSLEQEFNIRCFEQQIKLLSQQQSQEMLVNIYRQMLLQENSYKQLLKHQWGM